MERRLGAVLGLLWAQVFWVRGEEVHLLKENSSAMWLDHAGSQYSQADLFLMKSSMQTAVLVLFIFLWLQMNWESQGEQVEQHPSTLRVQERDNAVINCTYTDSASVYFPWYKQEPGKHPQSIIDIRSNVERKQNQRLILLLDKKAKHLSLHITATQPGDSAIYFCAVNTHCSPGTCSLSKNLPPGLDGTLSAMSDILGQHLSHCLRAETNIQILKVHKIRPKNVYIVV
ncbi:T-cell receptor alpha chain V region CTL-L17 [Sigmodon hispidus]